MKRSKKEEEKIYIPTSKKEEEKIYVPTSKKEIIEEAVSIGTIAKKKYEESKKIVEEATVDLEIILNVDGGETPCVEVCVNDTHVGYINLRGSKGVIKGEKNRKTFDIEVYKRGNGKWDKKVIKVTPMNCGGENYANVYRSARKRTRYAPNRQQRQALQDKGKIVPIPVFLDIHLRRTQLFLKILPIYKNYTQKLS